MPVWSRAFLLQFGLAAAVSLAATLVAFGIVTRLPGYAGVPLFVFVFSTAIAGYAGGLASGLLAVAFSLAVGLFVVVPPTFLLSVTAAPQVVVMFAAVLFLTALMAGRLRAATAEQTAARARAEEMATRLREVTAVTEENVQQFEAGHDDVAVLGLRVVPQGDRMTLRVSAEPSSVAVLRQAMRRWFAEQGITPEAAFPLLVAAGEAISNAIEHAYGPSGGQLQLDVSREADAVMITVRDFGQWRPARGTNRGRGFQLMEGMVDEVAVSHEQEGTEIRLRWRVLDGTPS